MTSIQETIITALDISPRRTLMLLQVDEFHVDASTGEAAEKPFDIRWLMRSMKIHDNEEATRVDIILHEPELDHLLRALLLLRVQKVNPGFIFPAMAKEPGCDHCGGKLKPSGERTLLGTCQNKECDLYGKEQERW